ncbi:MAG: YhcH/YjgK/YiaL family protein [Candidatus Limimorpha sp.]
MIYDSIDNIERYKTLSDDIYQALLFLSKATVDTPDGSYYLNDNVRINISEVEVSYINPLDYEAHKRYIDIHFPITGKEKIHCAQLEDLVPVSDYIEKRDAAFFKNKKDEKALELIVGGGYFAIFYPNDGHEPLLCLKDPECIKKAVAKIKI